MSCYNIIWWYILIRAFKTTQLPPIQNEQAFYSLQWHLCKLFFVLNVHLVSLCQLCPGYQIAIRRRRGRWYEFVDSSAMRFASISSNALFELSAHLAIESLHSHSSTNVSTQLLKALCMQWNVFKFTMLMNMQNMYAPTTYQARKAGTYLQLHYLSPLRFTLNAASAVCVAFRWFFLGLLPEMLKINADNIRLAIFIFLLRYTTLKWLTATVYRPARTN